MRQPIGMVVGEIASFLDQFVLFYLFTDRAPIAPREDLPLPTAPPFIAYVGNLPFDLVEDDLGQFFAPESLKSIKVIRDRDDKPKGFGYVEFETLDGLKSGLSKSGAQLNSRTVRVSVAEPLQSSQPKIIGELALHHLETNPQTGGGMALFHLTRVVRVALDLTTARHESRSNLRKLK
ncbi:RNA recognition motif domain-containing protein [Rhizoctonia solani AG-1 IA]|uniref:RNA recognition motif domain-containing protein n=1 Tax=Thanatephorus cucumeris (strain AG1-IA) TaxID=983506 RepID=L8WVR3_THACA|nr:RNA recognition motif domain-containing protein [Rhizoctonia solani AG-1 IA]